MRNDHAAEASGAPGPAVPQPRAAQDPAVDEFAASLLRALVNMAQRSKRRQADLTAALRGAGLQQVEPARVRAALRLLQGQGCIDHLVPLSDGGLLLSVTTVAVERPGGVVRWLQPGEED